MVEADIGIDLGTANVLVCIKGKGLVLREPTVVAVARSDGRILAIGSQAKEMLGRTHDDVIAVKPLSQGVISNFDLTEKMLKYYIHKFKGNQLRKPKISICVPSGVTEVERRAVEEVTYKAGAGKVFIMNEPIAAALGAGIVIDEPYGRMIVDIGGGTTDVAVISLGNIVLSTSVKIAGDDFDDAISKYLRNQYGMLIGDTMAEEIKIGIGSLFKREDNEEHTVRGRSLITGLPTSIDISSNELVPVLSEVAMKIIDSIYSVLEKTPPELTADIAEDGILITGGGSMINGFTDLIEAKTGIPVKLADDPLSTVAVGLQKRIN